MIEWNNKLSYYKSEKQHKKTTSQMEEQRHGVKGH